MPRPKDDAPDHQVPVSRPSSVKADDSWIGRPEQVLGRRNGAEGDRHSRQGMRVEPEATVQGQVQEGLPARHRKTTAPSARSSRWNRVEVFFYGLYFQE